MKLVHAVLFALALGPMAAGLAQAQGSKVEKSQPAKTQKAAPTHEMTGAKTLAKQQHKAAHAHHAATNTARTAKHS